MSEKTCVVCRLPVTVELTGFTSNGFDGYRHRDTLMCIRALGDALADVRTVLEARFVAEDVNERARDLAGIARRDGEHIAQAVALGASLDDAQALDGLLPAEDA